MARVKDVRLSDWDFYEKIKKLLHPGENQLITIMFGLYIENVSTSVQEVCEALTTMTGQTDPNKIMREGRIFWQESRRVA